MKAYAMTPDGVTIYWDATDPSDESWAYRLYLHSTPRGEHTMSTARLHIENVTNSGRRTGWHKRITSVDTTKSNGYAFDGAFLDEGEVDLPVGAIVVECWPTGSVKNGGKAGAAYRVTAAGELEEFATCSDWFKAFLGFRDEVAGAFELIAAEPSTTFGPLPQTQDELDEFAYQILKLERRSIQDEALSALADHPEARAVLEQLWFTADPESITNS